MKALHRLTDLQIALLDTVWSGDEATVREVYEAQRETLGLALKTVGTILRRLEAQGVLTHRADGRQFVYRCRATRDDVRAAVIRAAADGLFDGSVTDLVIHALSNGAIDDRGARWIRRALDGRS